MAAASLEWGVGEIMHEEAQDHVRDSLYHLRFFRDLLKRTGPAERERAEEIGWIWGAGSLYYGWGMWEMESDHLNRILAILDLPAEQAWVDDCSGVVEGVIKLEALDSEAGEALEASEEDLLITLHGEQEELDRLVGVLRGLEPKLLFCRRFSTEHEEGSLAETFAREKEAQEEKPHVSVLIADRAMEWFLLYEEFFKTLIKAWEVMSRGADG